MLLRICLIVVILLGAGTIFVTQKMARDHFTAIRDQREDEKKGRAQEKTRADKSEREHTATKGKLATTEQSLAKTEEELTGTKQQLATATDSLNKTKADLATAVERRKTMEAEIAKWESLQMPPEKIRETIANLKKSQDSIAVLEVEKQILDRRVKELKNQLGIILGENYIVELPAGTKGHVVAVDPKWNFVILDLGADKGMLEGGELMVHRNSQLVGKVRIREVMKDRSVANLVPGWKLGDIEEGDHVLY